MINLELPETPFELRTTLAGIVYHLFISPEIDEIFMESSFAVMINGVESGKLYHTGETWQWLDGKRSRDEALKIGDAIEKIWH